MQLWSLAPASLCLYRPGQHHFLAFWVVCGILWARGTFNVCKMMKSRFHLRVLVVRDIAAKDLGLGCVHYWSTHETPSTHSLGDSERNLGNYPVARLRMWSERKNPLGGSDTVFGTGLQGSLVYTLSTRKAVIPRRFSRLLLISWVALVYASEQPRN